MCRSVPTFFYGKRLVSTPGKRSLQNGSVSRHFATGSATEPNYSLNTNVITGLKWRTK